MSAFAELAKLFMTEAPPEVDGDVVAATPKKGEAGFKPSVENSKGPAAAPPFQSTKEENKPKGTFDMDALVHALIYTNNKNLEYDKLMKIMAAIKAGSLKE